MRDRRLQGIEAVVEGKQRVLPEGDNDRFFLDAQHRGMRVLRAGCTSAVPLRLRHLATVLGLTHAAW